MSPAKKRQAKAVSCQEAINFIPSDSRVVVGHAAGEPIILTD